MVLSVHAALPRAFARLAVRHLSVVTCRDGVARPRTASLLNADQSDKTTGAWGNRCRDPSVSSADEARRPPVGAAGRDLRRRDPRRPLPGLPRRVRPSARPPRGWHRSAPVPPHRGRSGRRAGARRRRAGLDRWMAFGPGSRRPTRGQPAPHHARVAAVGGRPGRRVRRPRGRRAGRGRWDALHRRTGARVRHRGAAHRGSGRYGPARARLGDGGASRPSVVPASRRTRTGRRAGRSRTPPRRTGIRTATHTGPVARPFPLRPDVQRAGLAANERGREIAS